MGIGLPDDFRISKQQYMLKAFFSCVQKGTIMVVPKLK